MATALVAGAVALVVAVLTPTVTNLLASLRVRRERINERFDAATASLLLVQAARQISTGVQPTLYRWPEREDFERSMTEDSIRYFVAQTRSAREALVAIEQHVPEVRAWLERGWELLEGDEVEQRAWIESKRRAAVQSEGLLRGRRQNSAQPQIR